MKNKLHAILLTGTILSATQAGIAFAQSAVGLDTASGDIIVTARKRDETSIAAPVVLTAIGQAELERRGINNMDALASAVPQLIIGDGGGTVQGGNIALRGISGADANHFADQAVSFNIDGVQVARATIRRMAEMDIQQIEVLKGPQALFFGKNSPGGIISIRTADPTDTLQAKLSGGYEFNAHEWRGDGFVSAPITDTLGFRIAGYGSTMRGWIKNIVPRSDPLAPADEWGPENKEYAVRGTLKFEPGDRFDARLKFTYGKLTGGSMGSRTQFVNCPLGIPQSGRYDECRPNNHISNGEIPAQYGEIDPRFGDGTTFLRQRQMLGSLEMNYHLDDNVTLTSVTGYYNVRMRNLFNATSSYNPIGFMASRNALNIREISQELRLASNFSGPVNFTVGGHYQDMHASMEGTVIFNVTGTPGVLQNRSMVQDGEAYSVFGQLILDVTDTLELSGGGRYSRETKNIPFATFGTTFPPPQVTPVDNEGVWENFSPEITVSYRPSQDLTFFGSYKRGFLSGGFNAGSVNPALRGFKYDQQTVRGFEGGVKAALLDGRLRTNFAAYTYKVYGLQVQVVTDGSIQELKNAGEVSTKGAEFDFSYRMPIDGLSVRGAIAYNDGTYNEYLANCYRGQPAPACSMRFNPLTNSTSLLQDLGGTQLVRAPKWAGNIGFDYEGGIGSGLKIGVSSNLSYSGSYFTDSSSRPAGRQGKYALLDGTLRLAEADDQWEVALIGRNLTDKYYFTNNADTPFTGDAPGGTGTLLGDTQASISRGREVMLRLTYRFGQ